MKAIPGWKVKRELARFGRQILNVPRYLVWYLFATRYYDWHLAHARKVWDGEVALESRAAVVILYPSHGLLRSHLEMLRHIRENGYASVVVSNLPLSDAERAQVQALSMRYIERPNFGYDFGGYRDGVLSLEGVLPNLERLVLMNDSAWYPLPGKQIWLHAAEQMGHDYVGAVSNYGTPRTDLDQFEDLHWDYKTTHPNFHYCSFALSIGPRILQAQDFVRYWKAFRLDNDKKRVVRRGEIGLTQWVLARGYTHDSTCNPAALENVLAGLTDARLAEVFENLILPEHPRGQRIKNRLMELPQGDPAWRDTITKFTLATASAQGTSYALSDLTMGELDFPFLKKSPLRLSKDGSDISLRLIDQIPGPTGEMIREEARILVAGRTKAFDA